MLKTEKLLIGLSTALTLILTSPAVAVIHTVNIGDFFFSPASDTVNIGDTVRWTHIGAFSHTTTSNGGFWDSGIMTNGMTFDFQFNSSGSFPYHCAIHLGMNGTIVVKAPNVAPNLSVPGPQSVSVPTQSVSFNVSATDANPGDVITITLLGVNPAPASTTPSFTGGNPGTFNWSPICEEAGAYYAKFQANDGNGGTDVDSVLITVQCVTHYIKMMDIKFVPQVETIGLGEQVCWVHEDTLCPDTMSPPCFHTTTSDSGVWDSDTMFTNDTFCFIFNNGGIYPYHCTPHEIDGMVGTIIICSALAGDVNGTPPISLPDVIHLVNFVFDKDRPATSCLGSAPGNCWTPSPLCRAEINGTPPVSLPDVIHLVNFVFDKDRPATSCLGSSPGNCWPPIPTEGCCF